MNVIAFPFRSTDEETKFMNNFENDLASAIGIDPDRVEVYAIMSGSIIVLFRILPSTDGTSLQVEQAVSILEEQIAEPESALYSGEVTSAVDAEAPLAVTFTPAPAPVISSATNMTNATALAELTTSAAALSITPYQSAGLFSLEQSLFVVSEDAGKLSLRILRTMGADGVVSVRFMTTANTATGGEDYVDLDTMVLFGEGEREKVVIITILDDDVLESHYEKFFIEIDVLEGTEHAAVGKIAVATVHIYDFGEGSRFANSSFAVDSGQSTDTAGWTITDNGNNMAWVDANGLYSVDSMIAKDEYNHKCDVAAKSPCTYSCEFGGGYSSSGGYSQGVLHFDGSG